MKQKRHVTVSNKTGSSIDSSSYRSVTLLSGAIVMALLFHLDQVLSWLTNGRDVCSLGQCSTEFWSCLQQRIITLRLLCHGRVKHASQLLAEKLLPVTTQMALAVVNKAFYDHALVAWRTHTLSNRVLAALKINYALPLGSYHAVEFEYCLACMSFLSNMEFVDRVDLQRFQRSGICRSCRLLLSRGRASGQRRRVPEPCGRLTDFGMTVAGQWLQLCHAELCIRFESVNEFQAARRLSREPLQTDEYFISSLFAEGG